MIRFILVSLFVVATSAHLKLLSVPVAKYVVKTLPYKVVPVTYVHKTFKRSADHVGAGIGVGIGSGIGSGIGAGIGAGIGGALKAGAGVVGGLSHGGVVGGGGHVGIGGIGVGVGGGYAHKSEHVVGGHGEVGFVGGHASGGHVGGYASEHVVGGGGIIGGGHSAEIGHTGGFVEGHGVGHGGGVVVDKGHVSEAGFGSSAGVIGGSSNYEAGKFDKVSHSQSSSSESNKSSKIKSGSTFGAGGEKYAEGGYDATKVSGLNYGASAVGGGLVGGIGVGKVGLVASDAASSHGHAIGASSGFIGGSSNTEIEQSESSKSSSSSSFDESHGSYVNQGSSFGAGYKDQSGHVKDIAKNHHVIVRRASPLGFGYPTFGGISADSSRYSQAQRGSSSGAIGASSNFEAGNLKKESSSKSSSSESSKSSRIKSGSTFGAGGQSLAAGSYDASKASQLNYGASAIGGGGLLGGFGSKNVGLATSDIGSVQSQGIDVSSGFVGGATNTEIEQSESNKASESSSSDVIEGSYVNKGSNFGATQKDAYAANKDVATASIVESGSAIGVGGVAIGVGGGVVAADSSRLSESQLASSAGAISDTSKLQTGQLSKKSSSKSTSSESNKSSKIKSGSTFGTGGQNFAAGSYDASKASNLNYGATSVGGFGGYGGGVSQVGLATSDASKVKSQGVDASSGYLYGNSNTEIEQSESNKQSASESHDEVQGSFVDAGSEFGASFNKDFAANKDASRDTYFGFSG